MNHQSMSRKLQAVLLALALGALPATAKPGAAPPRDRLMRLAIMPFDNSNKAANDNDLQALSNGIPESMIQGLKNLSGIRIVERENMKNVLKEQAFAQTGLMDPKTAPKIGALVGANTLMVGSFEVLGDQLRINARFIRADTGEVLGDKSFTVTGKWKEGAFQAMDDLAQKFVASFNVQTTDAEKKGITETISSTKNYDAYTHYLKGRDFFLHFNHAGFNRSIAEYQQALTIDPRYALAEAGMAYTYYYLGFLEEEVGNEYLSYYRQAEQHARKAIDLAPDSMLGHVALARVFLDTERIDDGRREVEAAVKLNPNDPMVRFAAFVLHVRDRLKNGGELPSLTPQAFAQRLGPELAELQSIKEDNPKDGIVYMFSGYTYSQVGMARETTADLARAIQLNPNLGTVTHLGLMKLYQNQATALGGATNSKKAVEMVNKAVKEAQLYQALDQGFTNPVVDLMKGAKLVIEGKMAQALPLIKQVLQQNPKNKDALDLAMIAYFKMKNREGVLQSANTLKDILKEEVDNGQHGGAGHLGEILVGMGDYGNALHYLEAYYQFLPNAETKALIEKAKRGGDAPQVAPGRPPAQQGDMTVQQFVARFMPLVNAQNLAGVSKLCLGHPAAAKNTFHALIQEASQGGPQAMNLVAAAKIIATMFYQAGDPSLAVEYNALFPGM